MHFDHKSHINLVVEQSGKTNKLLLFFKNSQNVLPNVFESFIKVLTLPCVLITTLMSKNSLCICFTLRGVCTVPGVKANWCLLFVVCYLYHVISSLFMCCVELILSPSLSANQGLI